MFGAQNDFQNTPFNTLIENTVLKVMRTDSMPVLQKLNVAEELQLQEEEVLQIWSVSLSGLGCNNNKESRIFVKEN